MRVRSERVEIEGHLLNRVWFEPEQGMNVRAEAIFYHGQGDHAERYEEVLHVFTRRGVRCVITELPGHGHSPGRRGHCRGENMLDAVVRDTLSVLEGLPCGVMGHSMGGLLALRHLILAGRGEYPVVDFSWLSSPLLFPSQRRGSGQVRMIRLLAPLFPALTIGTGVTGAMCRVTEDQGASGPPPKHPMWHGRISMQWGAALLDIEEMVHGSLAGISPKVGLFMSQGSEDVICPVDLAREFFPRLPNVEKQYFELEGGLHEPFIGEGSEVLFAELDGWLGRLS